MYVPLWKICFLNSLKPIYMKGGWCRYQGHPPSWVTLGRPTFHTFLYKAQWSVYMIDRISRLPRSSCLLVRITLGKISFRYVNGHPRVTFLSERFMLTWKPMIMALKYKSKWNKQFKQQTCHYNLYSCCHVCCAVLNTAHHCNEKKSTKKWAHQTKSPRKKIAYLWDSPRLCFSPAERVTLVPGSPSLHVNRPLVWDRIQWRGYSHILS